MYGTEINIKITDFDDYEELKEIVEWITYMMNKARVKEIEREAERSIKRSNSRKKATLPIPYTLETIKEEDEEETIGGEDLQKAKDLLKEADEKTETKITIGGHTATVVDGRIKCSCGVEYIKKNKSRHEKSKGHLESMNKNGIF
jgi:hypothetical protein